MSTQETLPALPPTERIPAAQQPGRYYRETWPVRGCPCSAWDRRRKVGRALAWWGLAFITWTIFIVSAFTLGFLLYFLPHVMHTQL